MTDQEPPEGWHWGIGERISDDCYTHWAYHDNWEIEMFTDPGEPHTVNIYEVLDDVPEDDFQVSEYPTESSCFETQEAAEEFARGLMERYH